MSSLIRKAKHLLAGTPAAAPTPASESQDTQEHVEALFDSPEQPDEITDHVESADEVEAPELPPKRKADTRKAPSQSDATGADDGDATPQVSPHPAKKNKILKLSSSNATEIDEHAAVTAETTETELQTVAEGAKSPRKRKRTASVSASSTTTTTSRLEPSSSSTDHGARPVFGRRHRHQQHQKKLTPQSQSLANFTRGRMTSLFQRGGISTHEENARVLGSFMASALMKALGEKAATMTIGRKCKTINAADVKVAAKYVMNERLYL